VDENQAHIDMLRAAKAKELLDNSVLNEALDTLDKDIFRLWGECPARDKDGKETLWQLYKTSQKFRTILQEFIRTGEYAESLIKSQEKTTIRSLFGR
jgi:hypothetical protein